MAKTHPIRYLKPIGMKESLPLGELQVLDLRLFSKQKIRYEVGATPLLYLFYFTIRYERGRSASTEDVTLDQLCTNSSDSDDDEPMQWRRVSKIRRSLQYPKSTPKQNTRPTDLPENLVNISKIKKEFENGFGSNFLKPPNFDLSSPDHKYQNECKSETSNKNVKKASFITADSLRDIRGKLKRLSDESLYKDDILASPVESNNSNNSINVNINNELSRHCET